MKNNNSGPSTHSLTLSPTSPPINRMIDGSIIVESLGTEFVAVPANAMGFVIGKKGNTIKDIQKKTGTRINQTDNNATQSGFYVRGNESQRTQARELINQKVVCDG